MKKPSVLVIIGSKSDLEIMKDCLAQLEEFGIAYDLEISSAHRNPEKTAKLAKEAARKGYQAIIAAAGMAAALPGVVASHTNLPVIGVPMPGSNLNGIDALLSMSQMPAGIPVGVVAIGKPGARNAAILAARIIAIGNTRIAEKIKQYRTKIKQG
ncbi:MAG: 5-(carboxyamino)imidazole ribonucleotide mutase [candidate division Zixibacteria bacterium]|nr:5-(carboxyamino)imidazole ribonucleotide mutase [candidate division Zixibacteria bacterium]